MDKEKLSELLNEALDEIDGEAGLDRLCSAIESLANAIENVRPWWPYTYTSPTITWSSGVGTGTSGGSITA